MAKEKEYVKLWLSYRAYFEPLGAAEVGRLVLAMIDYKSSGAEPEFSGSERFIWPAIRRDIDQASAAQAEKSQILSENGKLGGRPKKANGYQKKQMVFSESKKSHGQGQGQGKGQGQGHSIPPTPPSPAPTFEQVLEYAKIRRASFDPKPFYDYYAAAGWRDSEGKPVYNWQQKFISWELREAEKTRGGNGTGGGNVFMDMLREEEHGT